MKKSDKASPIIIFTSRALLVKMLITLEPHGTFGSNFVYLCILTLSSHWYEKDDEASLTIILAGRALFVKMLILLNRIMHLVQILIFFFGFFFSFFVFSSLIFFFIFFLFFVCLF